jgi:SHS2 domain-containing protein
MYEWHSHTAELELYVEAGSEEAVFEDALHALAELLGPADGPEETHEVELAAADRGALLVAWLEELLFFAETGRFVPKSAEVELTGEHLRATVRGRTGDPSPLVKAATYHRLEFTKSDGVWHARVTLDV